MLGGHFRHVFPDMEEESEAGGGSIEKAWRDAGLFKEEVGGVGGLTGVGRVLGGGGGVLDKIFGGRNS